MNPGLYTGIISRHFEAYHVKCLRAILGVRWWHKVTHSDLRRRAKVHSMECMVMQRQLRWVGHMIRMSPNRLPRRLLYSELHEGRRSRGGQMKRFSDNVKLLLKKCQIPPGQLEALASDRLVWRDVCKDGLATFSINYDQDAEARRLRRHTISRRQPAHAATFVTESVPQISDCAVIYASSIVHPQLASTASSSTSTDSYKQASKQATVMN